MSIAQPAPSNSTSGNNTAGFADGRQVNACEVTERLVGAVDRVAAKIAPVWPLKDYVAVNPYLGFTDESFLGARRSLRVVSDFELLMPIDYYREQFRAGVIVKSDLDAAVDELVSDGVVGSEGIDVNQVLALLRDGSQQRESSASAGGEGSREPGRLIRTISEIVDRLNRSSWTSVIGDEISKHCAAHYDEGQSMWSSPWQGLSLYEAWRSAVQHDRSFEVHGVRNFRKLVASLPSEPHAALADLLQRLDVPSQLWEDVLQCQAMKTIGWSAWTRYKQRQAEAKGTGCSDFAGLLAMRLAYEAALAEHDGLELDWGSIVAARYAAQEEKEPSHAELLRYALLKASEIAYRRRLLADLAIELPTENASTQTAADKGHVKPSTRPLAQMVFCIDVRSERIRRHLEACCQEIETFGFAGFFGLPIAYVPFGESEGSDQVPVLLAPQFKVQEGFHSSSSDSQAQASTKRSIIRAIRQSWKEFQSSAVSCFAFVETAGLAYGWNLLARSFAWGKGKGYRFDGVPHAEHAHLGPCLHGLEEQGITLEKQAEMAESILRGIGITDHFARLVVLCGHGSQTENNPLQAGLDCGACGGHSGEANARFAAKLLNQSGVRAALAERGIVIDEDVHFVGALHNTTTDQLQFFDVEALPESHQADLRQLAGHAQMASQATRSERLGSLPGRDAGDLIRRSLDWSEVRPEWGLAGNAAFIAAPRQLTLPTSLAGRSFLHSYDYRRDSEFKVLEQIMTAPMVVAHWINMQYYASTVDPQHFGSGSKTVHNVVGRFGILSGNSGDLMTGLPWQSVHDGENYQHHPLRLLVILAAPREAIEEVIQKHALIQSMLGNGWLQMIALDGDAFYRFSERQKWDRLSLNGAAPSGEESCCTTAPSQGTSLPEMRR